MSGNGSVRTALDADSDAARMLLNAYMIEMGLTKYLISEEGQSDCGRMTALSL